MTDSLRLGRIMGIPISVNWSVLGVAVFVVWTMTLQILPNLYPESGLEARFGVALISAFLFFFSLLAHELGHAALARRHDVGVAGITLWLFGGVAKLMRQAPTPKAEFQIAIAGPVVNLLLGFAFLGANAAVGIWTTWGLFSAVLAWLSAVNIILAVSNLIPAAPLDGGRVLTAGIWQQNGDAEKARLISARAGLLFGAFLVVIGIIVMAGLGNIDLFWISVPVMGVLIGSAARAEIHASVVRGRLAQTRIDSVMTFHPPAVPSTWTVSELVRWAGRAGHHVAFPVVDDAQEPMGLIVPRSAHHRAASQPRSGVAEVMVPNSEIDRAWSTESVAAVLERVGLAFQRPVVVHDASTGAPWLGSVTEDSIDHLFERPDFWGRTRPGQNTGADSPNPQQATAVLPGQSPQPLHYDPTS